MMTIRHSKDRGPTNLGWLQSLHTFSFGQYYDAAHMGVSALRVINDDKVIPGEGFGTHSHQDMEIISYVKKGSIEHKDSMGNVEVLPAGEFQLMSAGTGVTHSEYNPSDSEELQFLQIWVQPNELGIEPGYQQKKFPATSGLQLIASPDARDGSFLIHQDACLLRLDLQAGASATFETQPTRTVYVHMVTGQLVIDGKVLSAGDGASFTEVDNIVFNANDNSEALVFDLP